MDEISDTYLDRKKEKKEQRANRNRRRMNDFEVSSAANTNRSTNPLSVYFKHHMSS